MKGDLKHFGPTRLLNLVSLAKKTGTLSISRRGRGEKADLSFQDGKLVFISMNDADGSLVSVLQKVGKINKKQGDSLAAHAKKHGDKQLGLLLIQKGYVSRSDIVKAIKRHALSSINEFAKWQDGSFSFDQGVLPGEDRILVPLDLENIIIQIVRMQKRDEQLLETIPSLDVGLRYTDRSKSQKPDLKLSKEEWSVLRLVKRDNTLRMIAKSLELDEMQIRRVVDSLREAGLVELISMNTPASRKLTAEEASSKRTLVKRLIETIQGL
ncbi:MAG: DUF4388 domain-containing protein [Anaerolineae bacterium]